MTSLPGFFRLWRDKQASAGSKAATFFYKAFISYRHSDSSAFAIRLEIALKTYAKPLFKPPIHIFRDEKHLAPGVALPELIKHALDASEFLLLLASPESAMSPWVKDEIDYWCHTLERTENLIVILLKGNIALDPVAKTIDWDGTDALPPNLRPYLKDMPLYVDLREIVFIQNPKTDDPIFKSAINGITARFRHIDPNELLGIEIIQHRRNLRLRRLALGAMSILSIGLAISVYFTNQSRTRAERALLDSASRESILQTRDYDPEGAQRTLARAISITPGVEKTVLPGISREAALLALVENRSGPRLSITVGTQTQKDIDENSASYLSRFNRDATVVAIAVSHDLGLWSVPGGTKIKALRLPFPIENISFHDNGKTLYISSRDNPVPNDDPEATPPPERLFLTVLDLTSGTVVTHNVGMCDRIPCLSFGGGGKIIDIRRMANPERLAQSAAQVNDRQRYLVPTRDYIGVSRSRFHVFTSVVFDEVTQTSAMISSAGKPGGDSVALASGTSALLIGSTISAGLTTRQISADGGRVALGHARNIPVPGSRGVRNLWLEPDGKTAYFTNSRWGTGAGNGTLLTGAIDVESGRLLWSRTEDGDAVFTEPARWLALSDDGTSVIDRRTGERVFGLKGYPVAFSNDGSILVTAVVSPETDKQHAFFRLNEIVGRPSMAYDSRRELSSRGACALEAARFRRITPFEPRRWNSHDWRVLSATEKSNLLAHASFVPVTTSYDIRLKGQTTDNTQEQGRDLPLNANEKRMSEQFLKRFPPATQPYSKLDAQLSFTETSDRQFIAVKVLYQGKAAIVGSTADAEYVSWVEWHVFRGNLDGREIASGKISPDDLSGMTYESQRSMHVSFVQPGLALMQKDACSLSAYSLQSGAEVGRMALAFSNDVDVASSPAGILAIGSADWYGSTSSMQVFHLTDFRQGPWLIQDSEAESQNANSSGTPNTTPSEAADADAMAASSGSEEDASPGDRCEVQTALSADGRFAIRAIVPGQACSQKEPQIVDGFAIPPWSGSLADIVLKQSGE
jgi:hypothetical protein